MELLCSKQGTGRQSLTNACNGNAGNTMFILEVGTADHRVAFNLSGNMIIDMHMIVCTNTLLDRD